MLLGDANPDGTFRQQLIAALQDPEVVNILHQYSDYDTVPDGLHHQLGLRHDQSAYGDHTHDSKNSSLANLSSIIHTHIVGVTTNTAINNGAGDIRLSADLVFNTITANAIAVCLLTVSAKITATGAADLYIGIYHNGVREAWGESAVSCANASEFTETLINTNAAPAGTHTLHVNGTSFPSTGGNAVTNSAIGGNLLVIVFEFP